MIRVYASLVAVTKDAFKITVFRAVQMKYASYVVVFSLTLKAPLNETLMLYPRTPLGTHGAS